VSWIWRKLDAFVGAVAIALAGVTASQGQAFVAQYIQRLGGHLDEAKAQLLSVQTGLRYELMSETVRAELETGAQMRVNDLQSAYDSIVGSDILTRPFAFFAHAESTIIAGTWHDFAPALPLDTVSIIYVFIGMILGFLIYELIKLPALVFRHNSHRRRFRPRV